VGRVLSLSAVGASRKVPTDGFDCIKCASNALDSDALDGFAGNDLNEKTPENQGFVVPRGRIELPTRGFSVPLREYANKRKDRWLKLLK
jgi:hypothetical protein